MHTLHTNKEVVGFSTTNHRGHDSWAFNVMLLNSKKCQLLANCPSIPLH